MSMVEAQILTRVIAPEDSSLDSKAAEAILTMGFKAADKQRTQEFDELTFQIEHIIPRKHHAHCGAGWR